MAKVLIKNGQNALFLKIVWPNIHMLWINKDEVYIYIWHPIT